MIKKPAYEKLQSAVDNMAKGFRFQLHWQIAQNKKPIRPAVIW